MSSLIPSNINPSQWNAIQYNDGHLLIVAGPGTGKTHTLVRRIARLVPSLQPRQRALAITFTNKAAEEMHERLTNQLVNNSEVFVGTFHSFCLDCLQRFSVNGLPKDFTVATADEIDLLSKELWPNKKERLMHLEDISYWKSNILQVRAPEHVVIYNQLLRNRNLLDYDDLLLEAVLLLKNRPDVLSRLQTLYPFIFVDEYQDINAVQHELLKLLVGKDVLLTAIGDPNQAIYGFRGAQVKFFESFVDDFPQAKQMYLSDNYRCAANLLEASSQIISKDGRFTVPALVAKMYKQGALTIYESATEKAEAEYIVQTIEQMVGGTSMFSQDSKRVKSHQNVERSFADIAIFYRLNSLKNALEEALSRSGIPYQVCGSQSLLQLPPIFELMIYFKLAENQSVSKEAAIKLFEMIIEGWGAKTSQSILDYWTKDNVDVVGQNDIKKVLSENTILSLRVRDGLNTFLLSLNENIDFQIIQQNVFWQKVFVQHPNWLEHIERLERISKRFESLNELFDYLSLQTAEDFFEFKVEKVSLMTLHASKGLEFPVVFMVGCEEGLLPLSKKSLSVNREEERRLFYVGMTRAKEELFFTRSRRRFLWGQEWMNEPSSFLADIEEELKRYEQARVYKVKEKKDSGQLMLFD